MSFRLKVKILLVLPVVWSYAIRTESAPADQLQNGSEETRYLLVFKAYPPHENKERNHYEFAREIRCFFDGSFPPSGTVTSEQTRYEVFDVMRAKILGITDSRSAPQSSKVGAYVLVFNAIYKICARSYSVSTGGPEQQEVIYLDYKNGKRYLFPINSSRPFAIYKVKVLTGNIFREVWQEKHVSNVLAVP